MANPNMISIKIPTFHTETQETQFLLRANELSRAEMLSLRKSDPFMYFSVPGNLKACDELKGTNEPTVTQATSTDIHPKRRFMGPSRPIQRQKRVSYESDPLALIMDLIQLEADAWLTPFCWFKVFSATAAFSLQHVNFLREITSNMNARYHIQGTMAYV